MRTLISMLMLVGALLVVAAPPRGQGRAGARPAAAVEAPPPTRVQRLSFENEYVTGQRDLGGGDVIGATRPSRHTSLVRPRLDFIVELIKSADDL